MTCGALQLHVVGIALLGAWAGVAIGAKPPHIVVIMADDMGWNDISVHGSSQIMTPNIDALAYKGLVLSRHYLQPSCSPSRAAFLTGRYPVHTGIHRPIAVGSNLALPLNHTLLPQYLGKLGYQTRLVGKWHVGSHRSEYLPTRRGFDSHFGFYNGYVGYYDALHQSTMVGIDARRNESGAWQEFIGNYVTDLLAQEAVAVIEKHDSEKPLFLQVALSAPHTGNVGTQLEVRNMTENEIEHDYIADVNRRLYAGMVRALDDAVGSVLEALQARGLLENSIVLFMSDNGAPTVDPNWGYSNYGSNWPLRGMKLSCHDGGVRAAALLWSPLVAGGRVSQQLMHITDWLPTLYTAAGGNSKDLGEIDGVDQWASLLSENQTNQRSQLLVDLDLEFGNQALISWPWKVVKYSSDSPVINTHAGESGRGAEVPEYNVTQVLSSPAARALNMTLTDTDILALRAQATIDSRCALVVNNTIVPPCDTEYCLFNLLADPCETTDLSASYSAISSSLQQVLASYRLTIVADPGVNVMDSRSNPSLFNNYWAPWDDAASGHGSLATPLISLLFGGLLLNFLRSSPWLLNGQFVVFQTCS